MLKTIKEKQRLRKRFSSFTKIITNKNTIQIPVINNNKFRAPLIKIKNRFNLFLILIYFKQLFN
ncbi:hypothetical protein PC41400_26980 [Paenibacillus chitinolyticus]|uniref:Uncharacterized protein n=1 Tax=Paenibacillus chitinolyticus TaxID=79263 RepID=A0A410X3F2_9BACL|nr:hypothetical protein PC41400_26980 [Paenibacillus chitinolyticus]